MLRMRRQQRDTSPQRQVREHLLRRRRERNARLAREWDLEKVFRYYLLLQLRSSLTQAAAQKQLGRALLQQLERDAARCGGRPPDVCVYTSVLTALPQPHGG